MTIVKDNREHSFDIELATFLSIEKAIILKNVSYWQKENERRQNDLFFWGDKYWTSESLKDLQKKYPYMKRPNIGRWVNELEDDGWLVIMKRQSDKSFYRTGPVYDTWNSGGDWQALLSHFETSDKNSDHLILRRQSSQNETISGRVVSNQDDYRLKMSHNNIDLNIESNIEVNIEDKAPFSQKNENGSTPQSSQVEAEKNNTPPNSAAPPPPDLKITVFEPPTTAIHTGPTGDIQIEDFKAPRVEILSAKSKKQTAAAQELQFAAEVIEYLNQKAVRSFRANVATNAKGIIARYREGFNMEQVKKMVDHMCRKWGSDREMQDHLNPVTLFRDSNFERYYQSAEAAAKLGPLQPSQNGNYQRLTYVAPPDGHIPAF